MSQGPRSQGPELRVPRSRVSGLGSQVSGPGSEVLILDYAVFEGRGEFCKLGHKFLTVLKVKVKSLSNNFSKYPNPGIQFQDKKNPQQLKHFYSEK